MAESAEPPFVPSFMVPGLVFESHVHVDNLSIELVAADGTAVPDRAARSRVLRWRVTP